MILVTIDPRFRGPPESGNGGYCCGLVADAVGGPAEVTLRRPPPLATTLELVGGEVVRLLQDGELVAEGRPAHPDVEPPPAPGYDDAVAWSRGYAGFRRHAFPGCFVCGPNRAAGDGLRIFAGPAPDGRRVAAPWIPTPDLANAHGRVLERYLWAAMDCPGYYSVSRGRVALLGRMTARIADRPEAGERCVVLAWPLGEDGRKLFAGVAAYGGDGRLLGCARHVWIIIGDEAPPLGEAEPQPGTTG